MLQVPSLLFVLHLCITVSFMTNVKLHTALRREEALPHRLMPCLWPLSFSVPILTGLSFLYRIHLINEVNRRSSLNEPS